MISNFGATDAQVTTFLAAYEQANIRAAAQAVSKISSNILNTVALEMRAAESFGTDSVYSINGHTAEQRRELEGGVRHRLK